MINPEIIYIQAIANRLRGLHLCIYVPIYVAIINNEEKVINLRGSETGTIGGVEGGDMSWRDSFGPTPHTASSGRKKKKPFFITIKAF